MFCWNHWIILQPSLDFYMERNKQWSMFVFSHSAPSLWNNSDLYCCLGQAFQRQLMRLLGPSGWNPPDGFTRVFETVQCWPYDLLILGTLFSFNQYEALLATQKYQRRQFGWIWCLHTTFISLLEVSRATFTPALFNFVFFYHVNPLLGLPQVRVEKNLIHDLCLIFYEKHSWSYSCFQHIWKWFWDTITCRAPVGQMVTGIKPPIPSRQGLWACKKTNKPKKQKIHFLMCHIIRNSDILWNILESKWTVHGKQWKRDL